MILLLMVAGVQGDKCQQRTRSELKTLAKMVPDKTKKPTSMICPLLIFSCFHGLRLININGVSIWPGLFYARRLENSVHYTLIFTFSRWRFLRGCFSHTVPLNTNDF